MYRQWIPAAVAALTLGMAACGAGDGDVAAATSPPVPAEPVTVTAIDYGYVGLPARVAAGTTFTLDNESETEVHEFVAIRLPDDETRTVAELVASPDDLVALFPAVSTVVIAAPGEGGMAVVGDGTLAEPGRYAILCAIPTGADPAEYLAAAAESEAPPDVAGGPPHFAQNMYAEIVVE